MAKISKKALPLTAKNKKGDTVTAWHNIDKPTASTQKLLDSVRDAQQALESHVAAEAEKRFTVPATHQIKVSTRRGLAFAAVPKSGNSGKGGLSL